MEENKRFQGKTLNRKENERMKKAAKGVKGGVGMLMAGVVVKYGKDVAKGIVEIGKNVIFKA